MEDLTPNSSHADAIIIGGGIVGLTCALALQSRGYNPLVIDKNSFTITEDHSFPRVFAINKASEDLFQKLNLKDVLQDGTPYLAMHILDEATDIKIDFNARSKGWNKLGLMIEESRLKNRLIIEAKNRGISLLPQQKLRNIQETTDGMIVNFEEESRHTPLLIVTDGGQSQAREMLKIKTTSWPYKQHAIVAKVQVELPHNETAYQVFLPKGPLAFLPTQDPHICSIVWSNDQNYVPHLFNLKAEDFNNELSKAFAFRLGKCKLLGERIQFPLIMRHVQQYAERNWLIMGDAAHTIHPLAGLGLNVGLADLRTWLDLLDNYPHKPISIMKAYQRHRKAHVWQTVALMDILKYTFGHQNLILQKIRGLGMKFMNQSSFLKELIIGYANQ